VKVVHLSPTFFGPDSTLAGAERYAFELARSMSRVVETTIVTFGDRSYDRLEGDLRIRCFRRLAFLGGERHNPLSFRFLGEVARSDVVHCHQFRVLATDLAVTVARVLGKRAFVTDLGGGSGLSLSYHLPTWRGINAFLAISEFNRNAQAALPVPSSVVYGGVDLDVFQPGPQPKERSVLTVGRLLMHKGIHVLIEALDDRTRLDVVGSPHDAEYTKRLHEMSRGRNVVFHTDVSDEALASMYREATVTAIPTLVDGGYTTALESMACGTPVVGSRVGSLPELMEDGGTGFLVPPDDPSRLRSALLALLDDPARRQEMGKRARAWVTERFAWSRVVERCLAAYGADARSVLQVGS
jgi:glycosyltransferase involved in cell wall biosynthesis